MAGQPVAKRRGDSRLVTRAAENPIALTARLVRGIFTGGVEIYAPYPKRPPSLVPEYNHADADNASNRVAEAAFPRRYPTRIRTGLPGLRSRQPPNFTAARCFPIRPSALAAGTYTVEVSAGGATTQISDVTVAPLNAITDLGIVQLEL